MKTVEDYRKWIEDNREACAKSYAECKEIPDFLRSAKFERIWASGCWLNAMLHELGASEKQIHDIGFAHGQQCFFRDALETAVEYINEFEANRDVKDKPGIELAEELNMKHMGI